MSFFKKIPKWCWYVFPVAILLFLFFAFRDGGRGALRWLHSPQPLATRPPAITPAEAEEQREEIAEELKEEEEIIDTEVDELRKKIEAKFGPRPRDE